jgi:hypothetical protein
MTWSLKEACDIPSGLGPSLIEHTADLFAFNTAIRPEEEVEVIVDSPS